MGLDSSLSQAKCLSNWLCEQVDGRKLPARGRENWGLSLLRHSWDVADGIVTLLDRDLPGPAWTLARPLLESFVRGIWLLHCASDAQVRRFRKGECPTLPALLTAMESHDTAQWHAAWIRKNQKNMPIFHDFTHGGIEHVLRGTDEDAVESKYPKSELEYLVGLGIEVRVRIGYEILTLVGDLEAIKRLSSTAQGVGPRTAL